MSRAFRLAWRYVTFHKVNSLILIACISLTLYLPVAVSILLTQFNRQIVARAESTPSVIGSKGSEFDLTLDALYFQTDYQSTLTMKAADDIAATGLAQPIPLHLKFTAARFPIVGTTLEYFEFRGLEIAEGEGLIRIGDCVLGADVARRRKLKPGDQLKSDRLRELDFSGNPPLKMRVTGILEKAGTADDQAVFVDLKTAWIIEGLGHGHQEITEEQTLDQEGNTTIANAGVSSMLEITEENLDSFHFHGDSRDFPISAIIGNTPDQRSRDLLEGRYLEPENADAQFVLPRDVVDELMDLVFKIKQFFNANSILIGLATILLLFLVLLLSLKLREREMQTMFKLGCSRSTIAMLQISELAIICLISFAVVGLAVLLTWWYAGELIRALLIAR